MLHKFPATSYFNILKPHGLHPIFLKQGLHIENVESSLPFPEPFHWFCLIKFPSSAASTIPAAMLVLSEKPAANLVSRSVLVWGWVMEKIVVNTKSGDYKFLGSEFSNLNTFESKFFIWFSGWLGLRETRHSEVLVVTINVCVPNVQSKPTL